MKIRHIELNGFKSFADKITLPLHKGITCIVGPNGCGKSNVVDAFRWVLGEQSAKSLRGEKMEEVIFQGSSTKKQKGMAEITLGISLFAKSSEGNGNGNGDAEQASDEITVSRRLFRSGESEYLINKKQSRLKDIKDIFLDTGLDVKSYSILDQGRISEIVNAKPQDRRILIEEVAGVMKYKVRKAEALSKLESSKQNLQRINDIVYEVKRQINSLDRQVKKAERYKRLIAELKEHELRIAKREYLRLDEELRVLTAELERLREIDSSRRGELSQLEAQIETKRLLLVDKEKDLAQLEATIHEKERVITDSEKQIAILKTNIENKKNEIVRLQTLQGEFGTKREELTAKLSELDAQEGELSSSMETLSFELNEKRDRVADIEGAIAEKEAEVEKNRKELFSISDLHSAKKNELHKMQSSHDTLQYRESVAAQDTAAVKEELAAAEGAIAAAEESIRVQIQEQEGLITRRDALRAEIEKAEGEVEEKKSALSKVREDLASDCARLNSLQELIVDKSLRDFLSESSTHSDFTVAVLSDILNADKTHEVAIEAALSNKINLLILNKLENVLEALRVIKEKHLGRTALYYTGLDAHQAAPHHFPSDLHPMIIGKASSYITYESDEARTIAEALLENTYIVQDMQAAIEVKRKSQGNFTLVTLEGDVVERDGTILSGQGKEILRRKREIKELQTLTGEHQARIAQLEGEIASLSDATALKKEELKGLETLRIDNEKKLSLSRHSLGNQKEEIERKKRKLSLLDSEIAALASEKESLLQVLAAKGAEIAALEQKRDAINGVIAEIQEHLASTKTAYEDARSELTDMKLSIAASREKLEGLQREREGVQRALQELDEKNQTASTEGQRTEEQLQESAAQLTALEESIKGSIAEVDQMIQERTARKEAIETEREALNSESTSLKEIRTEIDQISHELTEVNGKTVESRLRLENLHGGITQKYGLDIAAEEIVQEGFDPAEDETKVEQLNEKIRDLGPVNLGTLEEYEELKTRYDFLTKQQQDLNMSIAELEEAISRINSTTRRRLREAFDALNAKFTEVFTTLFGGGKANLVLLDEENILDSGLDVIAQPPGKKLQNINLLSGGEKALTSLSLLFAGFLIKPSPLCILDEADAPLDESNTVRFAKMIKELSRETQFIIITHSRTTMEVADYLYGVTMEDPGASKVISLQFADVA